MNWRRSLAILALLLCAVLLFLLLYFAFTGAAKERILGVLFCLIVIPSLIYIFLWFTGLVKEK